MPSRDPDLRDVLETFCTLSTYGKALEAVNERLRDRGHSALSPGGWFKLLQFLRPNRLGPTVTMEEAFENYDIDLAKDVRPSTRGQRPSSAPPASKSASKLASTYNDFESKILGAQRPQTESRSSATAGSSWSRQTAKNSDDVPAHELSASPSHASTAGAHPSLVVE